ncbi:MAG: amidohydrolase family protein, partial [Rhizomicrobium sp.]
MIVDAHQHFWDPARGDYGWLKPDNPIHRVFATADLRPLLVQTGVDATILVQAAPTAAETDYMLDIARNTPWVLGVVGWIDLEAPDAAEAIRRRAGDPLFLGVRPMLQDIPDTDWILQAKLTSALNAIAAEGLVFDALILPHQIAVIAELARRHPQLSIVLDHAAKPRLGDGDAMAAWGLGIEALAALPNVACKVSGLLTEVRPGGGRDDIARAIGVLFDLFGPARLVWGSDWPVLTLS